ncbi:MAG: DUF1289 domain-containing protein [Alphaproteobacteria bacterium]|nr:DUF1289 domain-containing protein [Alphaproteobacteria bacterium]
MSFDPLAVSPCIGVCTLGEDQDTCIGCFRTRDEIGRWPTMDRAQRGDLLEALKARRAESRGEAPRPRRRGRSSTARNQ